MEGANKAGMGTILFLTGESQQKLMTQPHLLQNLCATAALYSSNTEIHRHIARCFANFALYGECLNNWKETIIPEKERLNMSLQCYFRKQSQKYASTDK